MRQFTAMVVFLVMVLTIHLPLWAAETTPRELEGVTITEHLGEQVDRNTVFMDHTGKTVRLGDFFDGSRPVLLTLNYYRCPMLCNLQLNALTDGLRGLEWAPGKNYRIVTLSIDPRETRDLASGKRATHLRMLGRGDVDWTFLTGRAEDIRKVANAVGFGYRYDEKQDQWAHPAAAIFLSPEGKVSRYLYGLDYSPRDIKFALMEASAGRIGSPVDKLILSCYHYDATSGRYGPFALGIMRLGGIATLGLLGIMLGVLWRRESIRGRAAREAT